MWITISESCRKVSFVRFLFSLVLFLDHDDPALQTPPFTSEWSLVFIDDRLGIATLFVCLLVTRSSASNIPWVPLPPFPLLRTCLLPGCVPTEAGDAMGTLKDLVEEAKRRTILWAILVFCLAYFMSCKLPPFFLMTLGPSPSRFHMMHGTHVLGFCDCFWNLLSCESLCSV
jgi:hypothetical protein